MTLAEGVAFLGTPVRETLGIACGALPIALVLGAPAAVAIVRGGVAGATVRGIAAFVRAIPDVVLAIVFVVAIGFGPESGALALGLSGAATVARLYAELLVAVRREPEEALRATGATATASFLVGLVPAAWPGLVGFGAYAFESIVRGAVIVGVVGAGGLGAAMISSLSVLDYHAFAWYVVALVALVVFVDFASDALRTRAPAWVVLATFVAIVVVGTVALAASGVTPATYASAPAHLIAYLARAVPPDFSPAVVTRATRGVVETVGVALVGTSIGTVLAVPLALALARVVGAGWMRGTGYRPWSFATAAIARPLAAVGRAIPPVALALVALTFVGLGPRAGALAIAIHTAGVLGKLFAESFELSDLRPAEALVATGSTALAAVGLGILPGALPAMAAHLSYRFEWNVRASTTLGIVGAGGLGQEIYNSQQLFHDRELAAYVAVAIAIVLLGDAVTSRLGRVLTVGTTTR